MPVVTPSAPLEILCCSELVVVAAVVAAAAAAATCWLVCDEVAACGEVLATYGVCELFQSEVSNLRRTPAPPGQHLLPPPVAREEHLDATSIATLEPAGLCPRPEARPAESAGDKGDPGCRRVDRPSPRHLQDANSPTTSQETSSGSEESLRHGESLGTVENHAEIRLPRTIPSDGVSAHDGMMARVTDNGAVLEAFAVTNGVKQGWVLAPTLISLMSTAMLMGAYRDERPGIRIAHRTDGHFLKQRWMHLQSHVSTSTFYESSLRRRLSTKRHLRRRHAEQHGTLRRLQQIWSDHQHGEDGGHAPTATEHSPQCAEKSA
ncbi:hypothetical protein SprV_0602192000 [Sparganum proliferum]